jgi:hypothetical protein
MRRYLVKVTLFGGQVISRNSENLFQGRPSIFTKTFSESATLVLIA